MYEANQSIVFNPLPKYSHSFTVLLQNKKISEMAISEIYLSKIQMKTTKMTRQDPYQTMYNNLLQQLFTATITILKAILIIYVKRKRVNQF